jgi:hypothetical protein
MKFRVSPAVPGFTDELLKWLARTFLIALLPLLAKAILAQGPYDAELYLFVLVLGASGVLEAAFTHGSAPMKTILVILGTLAIAYGALGYAKVSSGEAFASAGGLRLALAGLSCAYLIYKVPRLWGGQS